MLQRLLAKGTSPPCVYHLQFGALRFCTPLRTTPPFMDTFEGKTTGELREFLIPIATSLAMCRLAVVASWAALVYDWSEYQVHRNFLAFDDNRSCCDSPLFWKRSRLLIQCSFPSVNVSFVDDDVMGAWLGLDGLRWTPSNPCNSQQRCRCPSSYISK